MQPYERCELQRRGYGPTSHSRRPCKDNDGETFATGDLNQFLPYVAFFYASIASFLGANWGAMISVNWANVTLDLPELDVSTTFGPSDLYVRPLNFGWNWSRGDLTLAYALFVPTGQRHHGFLPVDPWSGTLSLSEATE